MKAAFINDLSRANIQQTSHLKPPYIKLSGSIDVYDVLEPICRTQTVLRGGASHVNLSTCFLLKDLVESILVMDYLLNCLFLFFLLFHCSSSCLVFETLRIFLVSFLSSFPFLAIQEQKIRTPGSSLFVAPSGSSCAARCPAIGNSPWQMVSRKKTTI